MTAVKADRFDDALILDPMALLKPKRKPELINEVMNAASPPSHLVSELDQEIAAKTLRLAGACTLRNSLLPIFKLPTELLSRIIFESVIDKIDWQGQKEIYSMRWFRLVKVCRRFREAVMSTSGRILWAYIASPLNNWSPRSKTSTERIKVQLEKSMPFPLMVKLSLRRDSYYIELFSNPNSSYFLLNPARLRDLHIEGYASYVNIWLLGLAKSPHALLKSLYIKVEYPKPSPATSPLMLPDSVFSGGYPALRSLTLENVTANMGIMHSLTELSMLFDKDRQVAPGPQYTFAAIISSLARSPDLTKLALYLPLKSSSAFKHRGRVQMSNLERLHLVGGVEECSHFLRAVMIPSSASLRLETQGLHGGSFARLLMIQLRLHLRGLIHGTSERTVRYLAVSGNDDEMSLNADVEVPILDKYSRYPYHDPEYCLQLTCHPSREMHRRQIFSRLIDTLPTRFLTHLDMRKCASDIITAVTWKTILLRLPYVSHISVQSGADNFCSFGSALLALLEENNPLPSLHCIYIDGNFYSYGASGSTEDRQSSEEAKATGRAGLLRLKEYMLARQPQLPILELCDLYGIAEGPVSLKVLEKCVSEKLIDSGYVYVHEEWKQFRRNRREEARKHGLDELKDRWLSSDSDSG